jgi:hypothetical protein
MLEFWIEWLNQENEDRMEDSVPVPLYEIEKWFWRRGKRFGQFRVEVKIARIYTPQSASSHFDPGLASQSLAGQNTPRTLPIRDLSSYIIAPCRNPGDHQRKISQVKPNVARGWYLGQDSARRQRELASDHIEGLASTGPQKLKCPLPGPVSISIAWRRWVIDVAENVVKY